MSSIYIDTLVSLIAAFAITAALGPYAIPELHKLKFGQEVRDDGPKSHLKKQGTPTMGGIIFIIAIVIVGIAAARRYPKIVPVLLLTVGFGLVGFADDYLKVVKHQSEGFNPKQKFLCQLVITAIFGWYLYTSPQYETAMLVPFTGGYKDGIMLDLKWLYIPAVLFIVTATDNGVNFTDGLDGLCSSVTAVVAAFLAVTSIVFSKGVSPVAGAVCGALLGFLIYNVYPAKVFMGDTGSLALGGFVAGCAFVMQLPLFIPLFGFIYLIEVVSVILQVGYFKLTHGKRIFRMAPIHHHFELGGWSETKVVAVFTIITILLSLISFPVV